MPWFGVVLLVAWIFMAHDQGVGAAEASDKVDFNFQIRPILADRCFKCHGPDEKARKAKLRLDQPESAFAVRDPQKHTRAIVPSHPEQSELVRRINTKDDDDRMPPPASNLSLNDEEKELLGRWVAQGAQYQQHWAFISVQKPAVPKPEDPTAAHNPIDAFVTERLAREGLHLMPEASRETLIRRLSFDLRGLPASLQEIDEFLADQSNNAYERVVDRFLASPAYGEQLANDWLDLARFADTYGYQNDVGRDMSPWRDWVIRAFNENLPYDQFIEWQLAGDLLPSPTPDQVLATAFNRLHRQTNEGGSIEEEFRIEYVSDRVATAGTAFLGLTLGCARCHDHKYDPISQKDFYSMSAFFNNIDESGLYSHFTRATPSPSLLLYKAGEEKKQEALLERIRAKERALASLSQDTQAFGAWLAAGSNSIPIPQPVAAFAFDEVKDDATANRVGTNFAQLFDSPTLEDGKIGKALKFSGDNSVVCKGSGAFNRTSPFSFSLWLEPMEKQERAVIFHRSRSWTDSGSRGYALLLEDGKPSFSLIHFWPGNALKVAADTELPTNQWSHLTITYDGSSRAAGVRLYLNGHPLPLRTVRDNLYKDIVHRKEWGDADVDEVQLTLAARFRDSGFKNGLIDEFEVFDRSLSPGEVRLLAGAKAGEPSGEELQAFYLTRLDQRYEALRTELQNLREEENRLIDDVPEIMVMKEMPERRATYLLKRGAYDARGDRVEPDTPERIFPFAKDLPRNRLGLAKWMIDPRNPLTARVAVNRAWRMHFGHGLVLTEEDFGTQGKLPTHPALLDWLAATFVESRWDLKALHKLIVMSATYRQSSQASPELLAKDPDNQLLARGPKHRLRAEEIRDNALAVSGLLSPKIGGPSVRPYQPEGLWEQSGTASHYTQDKGEGLYRRSLYTFWKRIVPPPSMLIFDAPTREVCTARRETTTTPLQALVLLNDPQFIEAARVMAEHLVGQCGQDTTACITRGFRLSTGREPKPRELALLQQLYEEQLKHFQSDPAAAEQYLKIGERPVDKGLPAQQLAATAVLASALMNLDEFVTER
ncbi:MAG TPA: DUF1553 domain-containing protein [Verrucomicrobiae bacterium]|nr:DUF1553 domain-containing protein [Verrucomicrobiae bacterium]